MKSVGPEQYRRLLEAIRWYERCGFTYIDVPWCVSEQAMQITRPDWAKSSICTLIAGGQPMCPVASAEQSFLQMQMDAIASGVRMIGKFVTITPCFRNEPVLNDLHLPYFMKVELIDWGREKDAVDDSNLDYMIACATTFLRCHVPIKRIVNTEPDAIAIAPSHATGSGYDIVSKISEIELGSYGIREYPSVGRWVYGTGLAEPRMTYAIQNEEAID